MDEKKKKILDTAKIQDELKNQATDLGKAVSKAADDIGHAAASVAHKTKAMAVKSQEAVLGAIDQNGDGEINIEDVIIMGLKVPGIRISRADFLRKEFQKKFPKAVIDDAVAYNPLHANIPSDVIDSIAEEVIKYERNCVSGISTALGMPGGVAMVASIPADIAQYYGYLLRATQKLMYLYGFPEIDTTEKGQTFDSETLNILIICMGVMYGAAGASNALKVMAKALASGVEKQLPRRALTKGTIYPIVKSVAKWFSVKMTKEVFAGFSGGWPLPCPNCAGVYTGRGFSSGLRTARRIREEARHTPRTATPSGPNTFLSRTCHDRYSGKSYTGAECAQPVFAGKRRSQSNYRYTNRRILSNHRTPRSVHPGRRMLAACKIGPGIRTECWGQSLAAAPQGHTARYRRLIG